MRFIKLKSHWWNIIHLIPKRVVWGLLHGILVSLYMDVLTFLWIFSLEWLKLPACKAFFRNPAPGPPRRFWPPPCRATAPGHGEPVQPHRFQRRTEESARLQDQKDPTATTLCRLPRMMKSHCLVVFVSGVWISNEVPWRQKCSCIEN